MTFDTILRKDIVICQPENGFRFGLDSVVLSWFTTVKKSDNILDIGSGSGILSVLTAYKSEEVSITAVELHDDMHRCLCKTVEDNRMVNIIKSVKEDIRTYQNKKKFDLIISNPPYRPKGIGRQSGKSCEDNARFFETLNIDELAASAAGLIKTGGRFAICGDADRFSEILYTVKSNKFEPKRLMFFYGNINKPARLFFLESTYLGGIELKVEPPLIQNSPEYNDILNGEWLIK